MRLWYRLEIESVQGRFLTCIIKRIRYILLKDNFTVCYLMNLVCGPYPFAENVQISDSYRDLYIGRSIILGCNFVHLILPVGVITGSILYRSANKHYFSYF